MHLARTEATITKAKALFTLFEPCQTQSSAMLQVSGKISNRNLLLQGVTPEFQLTLNKMQAANSVLHYPIKLKQALQEERGILQNVILSLQKILQP